MSFIEINQISHKFSVGAPVLKDFTLHIEKGECVGVTGRSGCGKSTLAQIIAGHLTPNHGQILVNGREVTGRPQRDVFLVHQDSDLFPWQRVHQQIAFGNENATPQQINELLELTKLTGFENYYPRQLSGGMKKRLSIARALAVNPQLLIFDESFSSLDFELRVELFTDLKAIWRKKQTTILLITHDPRDLTEIAQREVRLLRP